MKRHPADVTADRLDRHYDEYQNRLSGIALANMADTIAALRRVASDDQYDGATPAGAAPKPKLRRP